MFEYIEMFYNRKCRNVPSGCRIPAQQHAAWIAEHELAA
jgi:hypothetical protein